eukprot:CAMPEP_0201906780 /NCGR_PEP_ID=MMETSP0902-20130614/57198_1 /ASSEMBLY_ACC=CAM_ASM_000551 /TAXON_ID=420261 /ORGANISM="Thalassiosira antarctica, Strain CCMP982" /LENGTH=716 /DNA_ID=CAMNT_0048440925 /DNA_START=7 /DNA_END=2157 /DNA_ORIENTATION=+
MAPNASEAPPDRKLPQHGVKGAYYAGDWVDLEDCAGTFQPDSSKCSQCPTRSTCPRSQSRNAVTSTTSKEDVVYDVVVIGAGCIGSAIARELSRYSLNTLLLESADDVSQGATKGNSGIVHAGYDDKPGSLHAKFCWPGNQMFPKLDKELRFGYQLNGSLVLATNQAELKILDELMERGRENGVKRLRIIKKEELFEMEPALNPDAIAALHSPDAGNVIPYEFAIALAENAVDNGVELRIRREVTDITKKGELFEVDVRHWEPKAYVTAREKMGKSADGSEPTSSSGGSLIYKSGIAVSSLSVMVKGIMMALDENVNDDIRLQSALATLFVAVVTAMLLLKPSSGTKKRGPTVLKDLVDKCSPPVGSGEDGNVGVADMFTGGSGSWNAVKGVTAGRENVKTRYVINCAGSSSDKIAKMIGDDSFYIKPRLGDYLLLNRSQGHLTRHTIFPCPDPILGKGVLVQTTLWGNLILGPTARDMHTDEARDMSQASIQEYILSKCKKLCPYFDPKETIHAFCGARAKSSRGDWIIEPSIKDGSFIHVAGIDSPGLAGSPAIALEVVKLLREAGLETSPNKSFNPNRAPIITPKAGMKGLKMGPVGKNDSNGTDAEEAKMASNVICKCEKVTELEVVRAIHRSLPIDSTQAIRKRTRAGMGHCQGDPENYNCECRVKAIIARENNVSVDEVGSRPWPATSTLSQRWIDDDEKKDLEKRSTVK